MEQGEGAEGEEKGICQSIKFSNEDELGRMWVTNIKRQKEASVWLEDEDNRTWGFGAQRDNQHPQKCLSGVAVGRHPRRIVS